MPICPAANSSAENATIYAAQSSPDTTVYCSNLADCVKAAGSVEGSVASHSTLACRSHSADVQSSEETLSASLECMSFTFVNSSLAQSYFQSQLSMQTTPAEYAESKTAAIHLVSTPPPEETLLCSLRFQGFKTERVSGSTVQGLRLVLPAGFYPPRVGLSAYGPSLLCLPGSFGSIAGVETGPLPYLGSTSTSIKSNSAPIRVALDGNVNKMDSSVLKDGCSACPVGFIAATSGQTACVACDAGSFSVVNAFTSCMTCSKGTYQSSKAATACDKCPEGFQTLGSGANVATACYHAEVAAERVWVTGQVHVLAVTWL